MDNAFLPFILLHQIAFLLTLGGIIGFFFCLFKMRKKETKKYIQGMLVCLLVSALAVSSVILVQVSFNVF